MTLLLVMWNFWFNLHFLWFLEDLFCFVTCELAGSVILLYMLKQHIIRFNLKEVTAHFFWLFWCAYDWEKPIPLKTLNNDDYSEFLNLLSVWLMQIICKYAAVYSWIQSYFLVPCVIFPNNFLETIQQSSTLMSPRLKLIWIVVVRLTNSPFLM